MTRQGRGEPGGGTVLTLDPKVRDYLTELSRRSRRLLGLDLVGVYGAGSLALDAYQPERSDIDVALVCSQPLSVPAKRSLVDALRHESLPCPARGLELVVYRADVAAAGRPDPGFELELNSGPRMPFKVTWTGDAAKPENGTFWYAIDRSILAERGLTVFGAEATAVFRSVADDVLTELLIAGLQWQAAAQASATAQTSGTAQAGGARSDDAVLNACRAWQRMVTGHWCGKVAAGQRVLLDQPSAELADVVAGALAARSGGAPPSADAALRLQSHVLDVLTGAPVGR